MRGQFVYPIARVRRDPLNLLLVEEVGLDLVPFDVALPENSEAV